MNKLKLFVENFLVYGFGGIISNLLPLIMIPVITRIMPNSGYYGIGDLSNTLVSFGSAFAVMGMYDAMYRFFFEKEDDIYKKTICSTTFFFTLFTSVVVALVMMLLKSSLATIFLGDDSYDYVVYFSAIATLVSATNSIVSAPTRMQNKRKIYLLTNTLSPLISYSISIPLLLKGYFIIALPLAGIVSGVVIEISFGILNRKWFSRKYFNSALLKALLKIALPILPSFLIYWIFNSCDKIMITNYLGIEQAGIYSVASKIGNCSQLIYIAFAGGWQYFAFSTMKEENQVKTNSLIYEYLGVISFAVTACVFACSHLIFSFLFPKEYISGYISAPYLFFAPLLQMLYQIAGNQFLVIKKTWPSTILLSCGMVGNIFLNILLIPRMGIEGASLATLFGYIITNIVSIIVLKRMKLMTISRRFIAAVGSMILYVLLWRLLLKENFTFNLIGVVVFWIVLCILYKDELKKIMNILKK